MAAKYITKSHKVTSTKDGQKVTETISTKYRIDADFTPTEISEICPEFIENYCEANGELEWLADTLNKTITDKNGKTRDYPFVSVRSDFVKKFFPEIIKEETKKETWKERINKKLKGKKK